MYTLIVINNSGVIRRNCLGLSDLEFSMNARVKQVADTVSGLYIGGLDIYSEDTWSTEVLCLDSNQPSISHNMVQRSKAFTTEFYDRGPYSKYTRG